jgi:hypothetical protein
MVWRGLLTDLYLYSVDLNPSLPQVGVTGRLPIAIGKPTELPIQKNLSSIFTVWRGLLTDLYLYSVDSNPSLPQVGMTGPLLIAIGKPTELPIRSFRECKNTKARKQCKSFFEIILLPGVA